MLNSVFQVKLVDFGLVRVNECLFDEETLNQITMTKNVGMEDFMSPEMLDDEIYDSKTDVYSFGIVMFYIFFEKLPKQSLSEKINKEPIKIPQKFESISKCLSINPNERPTFDDVLNYLRENKFMLAPDIDPTIVSQRDNELELNEF